MLCLPQDPDSATSFVEIVKRPGQTLGLYIREGNGMDRTDGVFVSRIALESAVYSSQCIVVGDEILAVNLVDVTRMSLDDVVIIMSIPRRLVLTTRRQKAMPRSYGPGRNMDHKPAPVVVFKGDPDQPHEFGYRNDLRPSVDGFGSPSRRDGAQFRDSRTLTWDRNPKPDRSDPKYFPVNSLPRQRVPNTTLSPPREDWRREEGGVQYQGEYPPGGRADMPPPMHALPSYAPPPPVVTEQPRGAKEPSHFKPYKHPYGGAGLGKPTEEFYSPGYSQEGGGRGEGGSYMARPSSRLVDPSLASPYSGEPGSYRKPPGPGSTASMGRKSYTLGHQGGGGGYRGAGRTRNFSGDARSHLDYASDTEAVQSPPRSLRNGRLRSGPHNRYDWDWNELAREAQSRLFMTL